jgi:hypothetical protein
MPTEQRHCAICGTYTISWHDDGPQPDPRLCPVHAANVETVAELMAEGYDDALLERFDEDGALRQYVAHRPCTDVHNKPMLPNPLYGMEIRCPRTGRTGKLYPWVDAGMPYYYDGHWLDEFGEFQDEGHPSGRSEPYGDSYVVVWDDESS